MPILPKERDPRFITFRRGGTLSDDDHRRLAEWAIACSDHVLPLFEGARPDDPRPREVLEVARAWVRGEVPMREAHQAAFHANAAGRDQPAPVKFAALSVGQAVAVAHVAQHELGAAAYAIRAAAAAAAEQGGADAAEPARLAERDWQRAQLPPEIRELVLDDQLRRSPICWNVFDD
ncbi:putative immunity protein [Agromyces sp. NPDC058064]|uniref:putative immunity protein n=1 Tax=Agromyces sp. NPDC058064 TaxID=3346322 RepID=UPI0036DBBC53